MVRAATPGFRSAIARANRASTIPLVLGWAGIGLPLFAVLVAPLPVWAGQPTPRPVIPVGASDTVGWAGVVVTVGFVVFLSLPYRPYCWALRAATHGVSTRLLLAFTGALAAIGLASYPRFGSDIFDYAAYERMWVVYGENPLLAVVANHASDWTAPFVNVPDRTPAYGPLWSVLTWPIVRLAGDSAAAEVAGYKLLSALAYAGCCWFIWRLVEPARRQRALILFAWSPLVLLEALGKVHNDSLIAVSLLGMLYFSRRGSAVYGVLAVVGGALVKATAMAGALPLVVHQWRQSGWRGVLPSLLGGLGLAVVAYAPFWVGPDSIAAIWRQTGGLGWSVVTIVSVGAAHAGLPSQDLLLRIGLGVVWVVVCGLILMRRRLDATADLAAATAWTLLATVLLLTGSLYGHYFIPVIALAAVANDARLERLVLWLSIGGLIVYGVGALGWVFTPAWIGSLEYQMVGSLVLLCPAAIAMLVYSRSSAR